VFLNYSQRLTVSIVMLIFQTFNNHYIVFALMKYGYMCKGTKYFFG